MRILGINAYHGDSAACLVIDGKMVTAVEEERWRRIKHYAGFPSMAITSCLKEGGLRLSDIDHVAVNRDPLANVFSKTLYSLKNKPKLSSVLDRAQNAMRITGLKEDFKRCFGTEAAGFRAKIHSVEHHRAHLASAFFVSPFDSAAIVSVDGFGDFVSTMWGAGSGGNIRTSTEIRYPHSLGIFYLAMTQYLGFKNYGDEYKVMGMAAYGKPAYLKQLQKVLLLGPDGSFRIDLDYFTHHTNGVRMSWQDSSPQISDVYSSKLVDLLGPPRGADEDVTQRHRDLACSVQAAYEESFFRLLNHVQQKTGSRALCLAGGCAFNSLANGRIFERTPFRELFVQAAAGDAGGALGAAYYVWNQILKMPRSFVMEHAFWGPQYSDEAVAAEIARNRGQLAEEGCISERLNDSELMIRTARAISEGKVVGWFQGRAEWGPRALGNRSILGDPRRADMKDILNLKIKRRESFRPFAPSVLRTHVGDWFETDYESPFMSVVYQIRAQKRATIPAVTHVDGSGRLQTVTQGQNARYYALITEFHKLTGVPMVLNTSFNENEPIVLMPSEALDCFLRTKMDVIVMGNHYISRSGQ